MLAPPTEQAAASAKARKEFVTWCVIFGLTAVGLALMSWMGHESNAGAPIETVATLAASSLVALGLAAIISIRFSRK